MLCKLLVEIVIYDILPITECRFLNDYIHARKKKTGISEQDMRYLEVVRVDM